MIDFNTTKEDAEIIGKIVYLAVKRQIIMPSNKLSLTMDIEAAHMTNPLRLEDLLNADEYSFYHDIAGILYHINRKTGELDDHFLPRDSK